MQDAIVRDIKLLMIDEFELESMEEIPDDARMGSLGQWDSLAHVRLLIAIQEKYLIEFSPEEIALTLSFNSLVMTILQKLAGQSETSMPHMETASDVWKTLISSMWKEDNLRADDTIYIHSRVQAVLEVINGNIADAIEYLRFGEGGNRTLVLPAFPFTSATYNDYITAKARFCVSSTPAATGLLTEMILKENDIRRSAHPILSECAIGPKADWITRDAHLDPHPFHPGSTYARLLELDAAMIGLGVDVNTNAIIHMVDDKLQSLYPFGLYVQEPLEFEIELPEGMIIRKGYLAYSPDMVKRIKPRNLRPFFKDCPDILKEIEIEGVWFYRLRIGPFLSRCEEIARQHLAAGNLPPWFQ